MTRLNRTIGIVIACLGMGVHVIAAQPQAASIDASAAINLLKAGNARFVGHAVSSGKPNAERREATATSQHPFAIIVTCSDSRTPPELIFDQNIGDLFVIRSAGNVVDDFGLGSIEYAVNNLGVRLVVVLGHTHCGAVAAAVQSGTGPGHVGEIVRDIEPAVTAARKEHGDILANAINENVARVAAKIHDKAALQPAASDVRIVKGCYDIVTGKVTWLPD